MGINQTNIKLASLVKKNLSELPCPARISYIWNGGSLLGIILVVQIVSGLVLSIHFSPSLADAFDSVSHIMRDVNYGWIFRVIHANGASGFFVLLYLHLGRGLYYGSYVHAHTWLSGVSILLASIATAFLGYVLPWGQISFWGATVITNLFSAIPYLGSDIVLWLWGGFAVRSPTLNRFFRLHFLLPFIIAALVMVHLLTLHEKGSSAPLGNTSIADKIPFSPYFSSKDYLGVVAYLRIFTTIRLYFPWMLGDPDNFSNANPLVTPLHIQPEWYFLFAYAILRSIPNKLGGVVSLAASVLVLYIVPISNPINKGRPFSPAHKILFWGFCVIVILLTWIGARPVEDPYIFTGQLLTLIYFSYFLKFLVLK